MLAVATLGHALGFSLAAGVNLYATVAILGLASRFGWVDLPSSFAVFDNNVVIAVALALYAVEFVADKIPWVDSAWDAVHTLIRPVGGAFIARQERVAGALDILPGGRLGQFFGLVHMDLPKIAKVLGAGLVSLFCGGIVVELERLLGGFHLG